STVESSSWAGSPPSTVAPFISANRVAFHSLLQKLREPWHHSSLRGTSVPGLAPRASVNRVASAPNRSIQSSGSTTLPNDFDIFLPCWSRTMPCSATTSNGCSPSIAYSPNIIIRATQKNRMSYPVTSTDVGENLSSSAVLSGQPRVENGPTPEENQVSRTPSSWCQPSPDGGCSSAPMQTTSPSGPYQP